MKRKRQKRLAATVAAVMLAIAVCVSACGAARSGGFSDVPADVWYADAVAYIREHRLMDGTTAATFTPEAPTSRATLITAIHRLAGSPAVQGTAEFTDVAVDSWYTGAIRWAVAGGIAAGYGDGRFGPSDPVSREQLVTVLWRGAGSPAPGAGQTFTDGAAISPYAAAAVAWAGACDLVRGKVGGAFDPRGTATRAETAAILQRYATLTLPAEPLPQDTVPPTLYLQVEDGTHTVVFALNESPPARALYECLPLTVAVQDYSDNEKIFYLPQVLDTAGATPAEGPAGTLAYFSPWGNVVMYYGSFGPYGGLYALGHAVSGGEGIEDLTGTLEITAAQAPLAGREGGNAPWSSRHS